MLNGTVSKCGPYHSKHKTIKQILERGSKSGEVSPFGRRLGDIPILRGSHGLWLHYPGIKESRVPFSKLNTEEFLRELSPAFWYVYGHLFNKLSFAEPHQGYDDLHYLLQHASQHSTNNWFLYHNGIDPLYTRSGFDEEKLCQIRGSLF